MKTRLTIFVVVLSLALAAVSLAANPKPVYKVGDEVYVCNCGEACCDEISKHPGKCVCGPDMAKAKVVSVGKGKVVLQAEGWEKHSRKLFLTKAHPWALMEGTGRASPGLKRSLEMLPCLHCPLI